MLNFSGLYSGRARARKTQSLFAALALLFCGAAYGQNVDFNVTVNTGPVPLNADTIYPGGPTSLRITLSNNSTLQPLTNVRFSKSLPASATAGLIVNGASSISGDTDCAGGVLSTSAGQAGITLSGLTVPIRVDGSAGSGECYLDIPVTAYSNNGASTSLSYALLRNEVESDQGTNATGGPQAITLRPVARPTWSKTMVGGDVVILGGATKTLRITVQNPDPNISLTNIAFTDFLPTSGGQGAVIEPIGTPATGSCVSAPANGTVNLQGGATAAIGVSGISLAPQSTCTVEVAVRARHTNGAYQRSVTNRIQAAGFTSDQGLRPASDATARVRVRSPLAVAKRFIPSVIASGVPSIVRITLTNASTLPLPISSFTDTPIGVNGSGFIGLSIADAGAISSSCAGGVVSLLDENGVQAPGADEGFQITGPDINTPAFNIPASSSCVINITFTGETPAPDQPTTYTNRILQGAVVVDGQPGIVSQRRTATVIVADRLRVQKTGTPTVVAPGNPVRYQVTVQNFASAAVSGVTVADTLQNGSTFLTGAGFEPSLTAACGPLDLNGRAQGATDLLFTIPTIPARTGISAPGSCTITFWAMIAADSAVATTNQISPNAVCIGGNPANCNQNPSGSVTTGFQQALVFDKTFGGQNNLALREGQIARLRLRLNNYSVNPLDSAAVGDTLPSAGPFQQLRIASPPNVSNTCGGVVTAVGGETSLALIDGSVAALNGTNPGTCQVEVDVVGPAGLYPNTADVTVLQTLADGGTRNINLTDDATLTYTDTLAYAKSFTPDEVGPNGRSTVRIGFNNLDSQQPVTGISAVDELPAGMVIASPSNAYSTCNGPVVIDAPAGADTARLTGATLAPGANCALLFDVTVSGDQNWINIIPPGQISADGGLVNRNPLSATLRYVAPAEPLISKSITPGVIVPGEAALLTVNLTNGADAVSNLQVTDYFTLDGFPDDAANGMVIAPVPRASTNCPGGVVIAPPGGGSVALSGVSLAANAVCSVEVQVTSTSVGTITNTVPLDSVVTDQGVTNSTTFAQSTLSTTSDVGVSKQFVPAVVSPSEPARLRITFFNAQPGSLANFSITDVFPAGLVSADTPEPFSSCGGGVQIEYPDNASITLSGGSLGPAIDNEASSCYLETTVVADTQGSYLNRIPANSLLVNGNPVPHPGTEATLEVRQRIIVNKAIAGFTLDAGDPVGFTTGSANRLPGVPAPLVIRLENPNDISLTQVRFSDQLPDGLAIAEVPNLVTDCADATVAGDAFARELVLTGATLAPSGSTGSICTVQVEVVSNIPGIYTNEIPQDGVSSFEGISNELPTQAQLIISNPGTVSKDFAPPVVAPGVASRLSIVIGNDNELDMRLTAPLVDNLPASPSAMVVASPANESTTCPGDVGIIDAPEGGALVQILTGTVIPPDGCVVSIDVTAPAPGSYTNNIPVGGLQTNFGPSEEAATAVLEISTRGYISGKVFLDNQALPNGNYIAGQSTPIGGNTIELHRGDGCSDTSPQVVQTDLQGNYLFLDLDADTYSVCQPTQPAGSLNSVTTPGPIVPYNGSTGTPGSGSNPPGGAPTSQIANIVLENNGNADEVSGSPDNNFSEVLPATVSGNVYFDRNSDGVIDPGEAGIANVVVELTGPVSRSTVTAADGSYSFTDLPPGNYTLTETQPAGWVDGQDTAGSVGGDTSLDDVISNIVLAPADDAVDYNFGELLPQDLSLVAEAACRNDLPYVDYSVSTFEDFAPGAAPTVTVTWLTEGGRVAAILENQPISGSLLWPGASVSGTGDGTGWPGWEFIDDEWVSVPDDRIPGMTVRFTINPTAEGEVIYPLATPACQAQPLGTYAPQAIPATPIWALLALMTLLAALAGLYHRRGQGVA